MSWTAPSTCRRTREGSGAQTENSTGSGMGTQPFVTDQERTHHARPAFVEPSALRDPRGDEAALGGPGRTSARPVDRPGARVRTGSDLEVLAHVDHVRVADGALVLLPELLPRDAVRAGDLRQRVTGADDVRPARRRVRRPSG